LSQTAFCDAASNIYLALRLGGAGCGPGGGMDLDDAQPLAAWEEHGRSGNSPAPPSMPPPAD